MHRRKRVQRATHQSKGIDLIAPRSQEANRRIRESRREQILDAARAVFARKGLGATKVSDVAAEAGISHGLVYHYFGSKEDIFVAIVEQSLQGTLHVITAAWKQSGTPWDRISWLFDVMVRGARERPEHLLVVIQASTSDTVPAGISPLMERYGAEIFNNVVKLIREGQETQEVVEGDPGKLATALFACVQGMALSVVTGGANPSIIPDSELFLRMLRT